MFACCRQIIFRIKSSYIYLLVICSVFQYYSIQLFKVSCCFGLVTLNYFGIILKYANPLIPAFVKATILSIEPQILNITMIFKACV